MECIHLTKTCLFINKGYFGWTVSESRLRWWTGGWLEVAVTMMKGGHFESELELRNDEGFRKSLRGKVTLCMSVWRILRLPVPLPYPRLFCAYVSEVLLSLNDWASLFHFLRFYFLHCTLSALFSVHVRVCILVIMPVSLLTVDSPGWAEAMLFFSSSPQMDRSFRPVQTTNLYFLHQFSPTTLHCWSGLADEMAKVQARPAFVGPIQGSLNRSSYLWLKETRVHDSDR